MSDKSYLGIGMKFPPQINPATGRIVVSGAENSVKESVYLILMTHKSERFVRPNFGSRISSYAFMDTNATTLNMLGRELSEMILTQEPRISDVRIDITDQTDVGRLIFNIDYEIAATHQKDSIVFPYYLDIDTDEISDEKEFAEYVDYEEEISDGAENTD